MPPAFVALMVSVWVPTPRLVADHGLLQVTAGAPSMLQLTVAVGSLTSNVTTASVALLDATGPLVTAAGGG